MRDGRCDPDCIEDPDCESEVPEPEPKLVVVENNTLKAEIVETDDDVSNLYFGVLILILAGFVVFIYIGYVFIGFIQKID